MSVLRSWLDPYLFGKGPDLILGLPLPDAWVALSLDSNQGIDPPITVDLDFTPTAGTRPATPRFLRLAESLGAKSVAGRLLRAGSAETMRLTRMDVSRHVDRQEVHVRLAQALPLDMWPLVDDLGHLWTLTWSDE